MSSGVAEKTTEVGNIVVVHAGGDFFNGEVGLGKVAFEFIDDRIVDEGFGGSLHQAVADLVQIVGAEAQLGGIELHAALKTVVPQTVGEAIFGLKNDIPTVKILVFR